MAALASDVEDFLGGPLISWLASCLHQPEQLSEYTSLWNGTILHSVLLQIDPEPTHQISELSNLKGNSLISARIRNFDNIIKNLKTLYEDEFGQTLLVVPDSVQLGREPESRNGLDNMKLLILLLLGAAVQCPNKEIFIGRIKEQMDTNTQIAIMECIKQVTDTQSLVLSPDFLEHIDSTIIYNHILRLTKERDKYMGHYLGNVLLESANNDAAMALSPVTSRRRSITMNVTSGTDNHHAVELADWKAKVRKLRQELEEKSELLMESKEEMEHLQQQYTKLKSESQQWFIESRRAAAYRDEIDVLRERGERADRLEVEVQRLRDRISDVEFFKNRVEELREDNKNLIETKEMLEEQLTGARRRSDQAMSLETEIIKFKQKINELTLDRDADQSKMQELIEENTQLQLLTKATFSENIGAGNNSDSEREDSASGDNSLSEQLSNNAQARALKLELENRRLQATIEDLKESSFFENSNKIIDLEKEKKMMSLKCEKLQDNCDRLSQQVTELESVFNNALEENSKLLKCLDARKASSDRQSIEREMDRNKLVELEKSRETLVKEKERIQTLSEIIQRRADDLERCLESKVKENSILKEQTETLDGLKETLTDLNGKLNIQKKENLSLSKEVVKLREAVEEKDVLLDSSATDIDNLKKEISKFVIELDISTSAISKLQEIEKKSQELQSQSNMDAETIATLQKDLVIETLNLEKIKKALEKLGLHLFDSTDFDNIEHCLEKIILHSDNQTIIKDVIGRLSKEGMIGLDSTYCQGIDNDEKENDLLSQNEQVLSSVSQQWNIQCEQLCSELQNLQTTHENLQTENAKLKVDISTYISQIGSLTTQQVALQLANSQLVVEKDDLIKQVEIEKSKHENVLQDQVNLQCLHEQLNTEYESLLKERETLKIIMRDLRTDNRDMKEQAVISESTRKNLENEKNTLVLESRSLNNLRAEHSKLKDDFRNLFTASDRIKTEYKSLQELYRAVRTESSRLNLQYTDLSGEINNKSDQLTATQLELNKANQRCEMLLHMNKTLDSDRRTLMDHVSQLLSQYHDLLAHSLEDKQHYHEEEKVFTEKLNNLYRQKEKLEEKIMEHYRKLDSCSPKKKTFGSSLVQRVRKAGSDLMNKVPSRNRQSWTDECRSNQAHSVIGSESGGNDSDNSTEDQNSESQTSGQRRLEGLSDLQGTVISRGGLRGSLQALRRSQRNDGVQAHRNSFQGFDTDVSLPAGSGSALSLGSAGTRRTVYLAEENQNPEEANQPAAAQEQPPSDQPNTFLMYNRINTVIGEPSGRVSPGNQSNNSNTEKQKINEQKSKENAIWYEYGCV